MTIKPYTEAETLEIMMCETQNALTRCKLTDRMMVRMQLGGVKSEQQIAANQQQIKILKESLIHLNAIKQDVLSKALDKLAEPEKTGV